jgi:hypothetical protein
MNIATRLSLTGLLLASLAIPAGMAARPAPDEVTSLTYDDVIGFFETADVEAVLDEENGEVAFDYEDMAGAAVLFTNDEGDDTELMYQLRYDDENVDVEAVNEVNTASRFIRVYVQDDVVYLEWDFDVADGVTTEYLEGATQKFLDQATEAKAALDEL